MSWKQDLHSVGMRCCDLDFAISLLAFGYLVMEIDSQKKREEFCVEILWMYTATLS